MHFILAFQRSGKLLWSHVLDREVIDEAKRAAWDAVNPESSAYEGYATFPAIMKG